MKGKFLKKVAASVLAVGTCMAFLPSITAGAYDCKYLKTSGGAPVHSDWKNGSHNFDDAFMESWGEKIKNNEYAVQVWQEFGAAGWNKIALAAMIGSVFGESDGCPWFCITAYSGYPGDPGGRGFVQWTPQVFGQQVHAELIAYGQEHHQHSNKQDSSWNTGICKAVPGINWTGYANGDAGKDKAMADNYFTCCMDCQIGFFLDNSTYGMKPLTPAGSYGVPYEGIKTTEDFAKYDWEGKFGSVEEGIVAAAELFCMRWEVPALAVAGCELRVNVAKAAYAALEDVEFGKSSNKNSIAIHADGYYDESFWLEDEVELKNVAVALPTSALLDISDNLQVTQWAETVRLEREAKMQRIPRLIVMWIGILLLVYSVFLLLAFYFDRINNFVDVSILQVITFGNLVTAPDDNSSTMGSAEAGGIGQTKFVSQRDIYACFFCGLVGGMLLISGKVYTVIYAAIQWISSIIN